MAAAGVRCFLVGEALMRQADVAAATGAAGHQAAGMSAFSHFDEAGNAVMVDVTGKAVTERIAIASGRVLMRPETRLIERGSRRATC